MLLRRTVLVTIQMLCGNIYSPAFSQHLQSMPVDICVLKELIKQNYNGRLNAAWGSVPHPPLLAAMSLPTLADSARAQLPRTRLARKTSVADVVAANTAPWTQPMTRRSVCVCVSTPP